MAMTPAACFDRRALTRARRDEALAVRGVAGAVRCSLALAIVVDAKNAILATSSRASTAG